MESHQNQLIQECSELIYNLSKQRQRILNNEIISLDIINNYYKELEHVKLIIDYLIFIDSPTRRFTEVEFLNLCQRRGVL